LKSLLFVGTDFHGFGWSAKTLILTSTNTYVMRNALNFMQTKVVLIPQHLYKYCFCNTNMDYEM